MTKLLFGNDLNPAIMGDEARSALKNSEYPINLVLEETNIGWISYIMTMILPLLFESVDVCLTGVLNLYIDIKTLNIKSYDITRYPCNVKNYRYELLLININKENEAHRNGLIIDTYEKTIERYEPHGSKTTYYIVKNYEDYMRLILMDNFQVIGISTLIKAVHNFREFKPNIQRCGVEYILIYFCIFVYYITIYHRK